VLYNLRPSGIIAMVALHGALLPTCSVNAGEREIASAAGPGTPTIDRQPIGRRATEGGPVAFSVIAQGSAPLAYQWWRGANPLTNHSRLAGATNAVLNITPVLVGDSGDYSVVVSSGAASITSSVVSLTVTQMFVPTPVPLGTTGAVFSILALPGDVYRIESRVDFGTWATNGYATNFTGRAEYRDFYSGTGFRQLRMAYERLLPVLQPPLVGTAAVPVYGTIGEIWRLRSSPDLQAWSDVATRTNETGWVFFTNSPATPSRFYRVAPPLF
jgi:hypothetical protein